MITEGKHVDLNALSRGDPLSVPPTQALRAPQITCDRVHYFYDICKVNGPTLDPTTSTFYTMGTPDPPLVEKIQPYPRKWESLVMSRIKEITLTSSPQSPPCQVKHEAPALVFSAGGYTGNFFHEFNDGFIPLYITVNSMFENQDLVLVISKSRDWWITKSRPRLVLVIRTGNVGRVLLNHKEVKQEAEKVGFEVVVFEPKPSTPLSVAYKLMNSSHAMVGVHGAAMTHTLFLRPGSVFVQVVPLGTQKAAALCYGKPAKAIGVEYMEYRIDAEESSLINKYGKEDKMIKEPMGFEGNNWSYDIMKIYLKEQNVRVDLERFRGYLKEAYEKGIKLLDREWYNAI
ncbi:hypothetical protein FEM48_Zijuj10G0091300 [Ziziphus jujuba var. spinosa]|uniref:Glycosyltransferase 61 catalytic domain-containing protein n=1 Tax=Ziziphus jujuba var. spinosa TaxID=714518 RepID=A0A978UMH8_ZIZJJ|nr:hypothetical protein FEM48_Zijuj10G0091300 [Ziziphus jujuba var. spinosa]